MNYLRVTLRNKPWLRKIMIIAMICVVALGIMVIVMQPFLIAPWNVDQIFVYGTKGGNNNSSPDYLRQPVVIDGLFDKYYVCGLLAMSSKHLSDACPSEICLAFICGGDSVAILLPSVEGCATLRTQGNAEYYKFYGKRPLFAVLERYAVRISEK